MLTRFSYYKEMGVYGNNLGLIQVDGDTFPKSSQWQKVSKIQIILNSIHCMSLFTNLHVQKLYGVVLFLSVEQKLLTCLSVRLKRGHKRP